MDQIPKQVASVAGAMPIEEQTLNKAIKKLAPFDRALLQTA